MHKEASPLSCFFVFHVTRRVHEVLAELRKRGHSMKRAHEGASAPTNRASAGGFLGFFHAMLSGIAVAGLRMWRLGPSSVTPTKGSWASNATRKAKHAGGDAKRAKPEALSDGVHLDAFKPLSGLLSR